jgi:hypothetical protein
VINTGPAVRNVSATLSASVPTTIVLDGSLAFGEVAAGATVPSSDTFIIRQNRTTTFNPAVLLWTILSEPVQFGVTISEPADGLLVNGANVTVRGSASGASSVLVNGSLGTLNGSNFSVPLTLREGNNTITAVATDAGGTVATAGINVTLDSTAPRLAITSPLGDSIQSEPSVTVSGTVNDTVVGTINSDQVTVTVNGIAAPGDL